MSAILVTYSVIHSKRIPLVMAITTFTAAHRASRRASSGRAVSTWIVNGITDVFFASLERCLCIRISTDEGDFRDDEDETTPLLFSNRKKVNILNKTRENINLFM